ncbi:uncharacterized protein LOC143476102 [Brachyhypopomus gauderio]|uniref:uncharacterized protein LOC143476102 n=1 Tax=Brachyhypopomus gauderio TaxID=698409 RepID=UPI00404113E3
MHSGGYVSKTADELSEAWTPISGQCCLSGEEASILQADCGDSMSRQLLQVVLPLSRQLTTLFDWKHLRHFDILTEAKYFIMSESLVACVECGMYSYSSSVSSDDNNNFICVKCRLVISMTEKISLLEERIRALESAREFVAASTASVAASAASVAGPGCTAVVSEPSAPALEPSQRGEWVTSRRHNRRAEHHSSQVPVSNRFAPLSNTQTERPQTERPSTHERSNEFTPGTQLTPAAIVKRIPGARAPDIRANLKVLAKRKYSKIVIHVGTNDVGLRQSEITKDNIKEVCELAGTMSDAVICSGPIPVWRGAETYSRLWVLHRWMSKWCSDNKVGYIDNWTRFEGRPGLLKRDGIHPSWEGAALISRSISARLNSGSVGVVNGD